MGIFSLSRNLDTLLHSLVKTELCYMIFNVDYYDKECFSIDVY